MGTEGRLHGNRLSPKGSGNSHGVRSAQRFSLRFHPIVHTFLLAAIQYIKGNAYCFLGDGYDFKQFAEATSHCDGNFWDFTGAFADDDVDEF